jgi:hypothetical protein
MEAYAEERYNELRQALDVDLLNIDAHLIRQPQQQMEASEFAAEAASEYASADAAYKTILADAANRLRRAGDKKPPESQLAMDVLLEEDVMDAESVRLQLRLDLDKWRALVDALKSKASIMKTSADLINSGYLSPKSIIDKGRENMHRERAARG